MDLLRPLAERVLKTDLEVMKESISRLSESVSELRAEERGWINISQGAFPGEFSGEERLNVLKKAREAYDKNPLAGQIVDIKRYFTMGQGISFKAEDPGVNEILKSFWKDESNKWFQRQSQLSDDLEIEGEFFLRFFTNEYTGRVQVRSIPATQVVDVIVDPEDSETPIYYRREWVEQVWDEASKQYQIVKYHTGAAADFIPAEEVLHIKIGVPLYAKFGRSPMYCTLGYLNAYKEWLEDRVKINKAKATFAWKKKIKGVATGMANAASKVVAALNKVVSGAERPIPPKTGGVIVENEGVEWETISPQIGADDASEDGRAIKLMICAGSGIFEHYLGDAKVGNLASTKSMELPMLKMFEWRQKLFENVFQTIFRRVVKAAVEARVLPEKITVTRQSGGKTEEIEILTVDVNIDIDFPPLVLREIKDLTDSLVKQVESKFKSRQTAAMELGVEDWEQEKAMMTAEEEEAAAKARENDTNLWPSFEPPEGDPGGGDPNGKQTKKA